MTTIVEIRAERNISQENLAKTTGLSIPAISRLENGHPVQKSTLVLICQALGVDLKDVTGVNIYNAVASYANRRKA